MNLIALINTDMLYAKALAEQIPYFKFSTWIDQTVQKEVIKQLLGQRQNQKSAVPQDLITGNLSSKQQKQNAARKNQMRSQLIAFLNKKASDQQLTKPPQTMMLATPVKT